jgi:hypothetical protein
MLIARLPTVLEGNTPAENAPEMGDGNSSITT